MEIFFSILTILIPYFLIVALGGTFRNRLSENAWLGLDKLNFDIFFPALLFSAAASRPIALKEVATVGLSVWALILMALGIAFLLRRLGPERFVDFAALWQCSWRFNSAVGFVAVAALSTPGPANLMPVVIGLAVPLANLCAISALSRAQSLTVWKTIRAISLNPFFLASFGGVVVGLLNIQIPGPILAPIEVLAKAAIPLALLSIGATMDWKALGKITLFDAWLNGVKLLALPFLALQLGWFFGLSVDLHAALIVFAALPTASAAHVLASGFGAKRMPTATLIAQSTLLSAISLPFWVYVAHRLINN